MITSNARYGKIKVERFLQLKKISVLYADLTLPNPVGGSFDTIQFVIKINNIFTGDPLLFTYTPIVEERKNINYFLFIIVQHSIFFKS